MQMLVDYHAFEYRASVPWPRASAQQIDWELGVRTIESWLTGHVGARLHKWAWNDSGEIYQIGVGFRWEQDRLLFVLAWGR